MRPLSLPLLTFTLRSKAQHEAIDRLFARLVKLDLLSFQARAAEPWEALVQGNSALEKAVKA